MSPQPGQIAPILTNTQVKLITKNCFKNICQKCNFKSHQDNLCKGATAFSHLYSSHHQTAHPHHAHLRPYPPIFHTHFKRDLLSLRQFFVVKSLFFKILKYHRTKSDAVRGQIINFLIRRYLMVFSRSGIQKIDVLYSYRVPFRSVGL